MTDDREARSTCLNPFCGRRTAERVLRCPGCGRPAFGDDEIARRGRHILLLAIILTAAIAGSLWMIGATLLGVVASTATTANGATAADAALALAGLVPLLLMGLALFATGLCMIAARSSRWPTIAAITFFAVAGAAIGTFAWSFAIR